MTEENLQFNTIVDNTSEAGVCGPDGCSIADHQKVIKDTIKKDK